MTPSEAGSGRAQGSSGPQRAAISPSGRKAAKDASTTSPGQSTTRATSPDPHDLDLTLTEVKELYCFLDGSIQNPHVRHQLWKSWGHCPRHAWAFAVANCELRLRPFQTAILYEDLAGRAARLLSRPLLPRTAAERLLRPHGACFTCDYCALATSDPGYESIAYRVNRRRVIGEWVGELRPVWEPRSCPLCLGGEGLVCRPHLLGGVAWDLHRTARGLHDLQGRLRMLVRSMTWKGPTATIEDRASVVEALGWFAGWAPAAAIAAEAASRGIAPARHRAMLRRVR